MPEWHENRLGKPPRNGTVKLLIEWKNGTVSKHTFTANQLRWTITNHPFDIGRYAKVEG